MRNVIALALLAATALAPSGWAQDVAPMPADDKILAALSADNPELTAAYKRNAATVQRVNVTASPACAATNHSRQLTAGMADCRRRGVSDHGEVAVLVPRPPVIPPAPPVTADDPCPAGRGQCAISIWFATGSADLTADARSRLDHLREVLERIPGPNFKFLVEGHTDTTGNRLSNKSLSERRALAAARYLAQTPPMKMEKFLVSGVGEDNPVVPTAEQVDEPRNRVVMIGRVGV